MLRQLCSTSIRFLTPFRYRINAFRAKFHLEYPLPIWFDFLSRSKVDDEWPHYKPPSEDLKKSPPTWEEISIKRESLKKQWTGVQDFNEIKGSFEDAIQSSVVYFRVHYNTLTVHEISKLLIHFSELLPDVIYQSWMVNQTAESLIWSIQIFLEKFNDHEVELNQDCFVSTMKALSKFGPPLRDYCIKSDPDQTLWKLTPIASKLVPNLTVDAFVDLVTSFGWLLIRDEEFLEEVILYLDVNWSQFDASSLISIIYSFARLDFRKCSRIVKRVTSVISANPSELTPREIILMMTSITRLKWTNVYSMWTILIHECSYRLRELSNREMLSLLRDLFNNRNHAGNGFIQALIEDVLRRLETSTTKELLVESLLLLGQLGYPHEKMLKHLKTHLYDYMFTLSDSIRIGWVLSMFNAFDEGLVKWWVSRMDKADQTNTTHVEQRQFYQTLMHIYVLQSNYTSLLDLDPKFETICMQNWMKHIKANAELGFVCHRSEYVLGWRLSISTISHPKFHQRFCLMVPKGFDNFKQRIRGGQKWKMRMLEEIGWTILVIYEDEWMVLTSKEMRHGFVLQRLKSTINKRIAVEKGASPYS
eukprot:g8837.t1